MAGKTKDRAAERSTEAETRTTDPTHPNDPKTQLRSMIVEWCPDVLMAWEIGTLNDTQALICVCYHGLLKIPKVATKPAPAETDAGFEPVFNDD